MNFSLALKELYIQVALVIYMCVLCYQNTEVDPKNEPSFYISLISLPLYEVLFSSSVERILMRKLCK